MPHPALQRARSLLSARPTETGLEGLVGRVVEVSESTARGAVSVVSSWMLEAQRAGEPVAWIATGASVPYAPDWAYLGLDVNALPLVLVPHATAGLEAADVLVRAGAWGLVVVDWAGGAVEEGVLGRLARLAEDQRVAVVFLTRKAEDAPSLGSQVSLRGHVTDEGEAVVWRITRDKRGGSRERRWRFDGPSGLY